MADPNDDSNDDSQRKAKEKARLELADAVAPSATSKSHNSMNDDERETKQKLRLSNTIAPPAPPKKTIGKGSSRSIQEQASRIDAKNHNKRELRLAPGSPLAGNRRSNSGTNTDKSKLRLFPGTANEVSSPSDTGDRDEEENISYEVEEVIENDQMNHPESEVIVPEAVAVQEEDHIVSAVASKMEPSSSSCLSSRKVWFILFVILVVTIGSILAAVMATTVGEEEAPLAVLVTPAPSASMRPSTIPSTIPTRVPTFAPSTERYAQIINSLDDESNLQTDALKWLIETDQWSPPSNETTDATIEIMWKERYSLVAFLWTFNFTAWLDPSTSVCDWQDGTYRLLGGTSAPKGIRCNEKDHAIGLFLRETNLTGTLPSDIFEGLVNLQDLVLGKFCTLRSNCEIHSSGY